MGHNLIWLRTAIPPLPRAQPTARRGAMPALLLRMQAPRPRPWLVVSVIVAMVRVATNSRLCSCPRQLARGASKRPPLAARPGIPELRHLSCSAGSPPSRPAGQLRPGGYQNMAALEILNLVRAFRTLMLWPCPCMGPVKSCMHGCGGCFVLQRQRSRRLLCGRTCAQG